ncbi:MAG: 5'-methylthioadenosine/S-adenosylhomocysteine nucleosidase, partial [Spirochaetia bacterium]
MILILGALEGEIQAFAENGEDMHTVETAFFTCMKGKLFGIPAVIAATGVGKVLAALAAQYLIDCYNPEAVIMLGAAGGLRQNMNIGDIIIATDCLQYDFDATAFGFKIGEIPYQRIGPIECDNRM